MTATWDRTWLTPEQRAERLAAAPPEDVRDTLGLPA